MKKTLNRSLSLLLALVLAVSLAVPALAADEPVTLDQTKLSLSPKQSVVLHATRSSEYQDQRITWKSSDTSVATLSDQDHKKGNVTITAKKKGTTAITASVGGYLAVCNVTVEDDYVTDVTITPAGPETLPVGKTRQLEAEVVYAHGTQGDQTVTWTTDNPKVATVTQKGLVTAVSEGTAEIVALSKEGSKNGTPVMETYQLTVTKQGASSADDVLSLSATTVTTSGGQYVDTVLKAPVVTIRSGATDVTDAYTLLPLDRQPQKELGTQDTQLIQPVTLSDLTVTCTVTATSKTDSTQVLTGSCRYGVKVYPGTTVGAAHALTKGSVTLDKLMDLEGKQSILDQLLQGDGDSLLTPAIPGLTHVVFDMNSVTGAAVGTLSARGEVEYYLSREADGNHLADVSFTPLQAGTYGINFLAYGDQVYYGRLEVVVSGQAVEPPDGEDIPCDCTGYTFTGSDFFHSGDADPVAAVLFGKPSAGQLLRDLAHGSGVAEEGARYYTNAASNGEYHVSTLSYLPNAGFSGRVTLPVTLITQSGKQVEDTLSFYVTSKTHSEQFTDVTETTVGLWAADAVDFAYHFGLVSGVEETKFAPNSPMTRAQLVTVLYRAAGSPEVTVTTNFEDLDVGAYYYNAVVWGNVMGVVNGTSDTTFSPNAYVTREQLATILYRYADTMGDNVAVSGNLNAYTDKDKVGSYAVTPMTWAVEHGIITGTTGTTLSPKSTTTRAQVAVMLHRYLTD
ncbi:MAG: S-layer homology domain-containing protein [Evtepia gabavorous]